MKLSHGTGRVNRNLQYKTYRIRSNYQLFGLTE